jgi:hypothetical protein
MTIQICHARLRGLVFAALSLFSVVFTFAFLFLCGADALREANLFETHDTCRHDHKLSEKYVPRIVVEHGVKALRDRNPQDLIRGMIDPDHPDYELCTFESAALELAPLGNANAEYILGWISMDRFCSSSNLQPPASKLASRINLNNLGLTASQKRAVPWYLSASRHGCSAASVALGRMFENSYGEERERGLKLAVHFYEKGIEQGDVEAKSLLACCYARGNGVKTDSRRAWRDLEEVITRGDADASTYAIVLALSLWKDEKLTPPPAFTQGAAKAFEFARRYDSSINTAEQLDIIYMNPGFTPNPYPQLRWRLATRIRGDWVKITDFSRG